MAGIIIKNDFILSGSHRTFEQYINYINRQEKIEDIKYTGYFDYVDRERTAFTAEQHITDEKDILKIKQIFSQAQENGSNLWRSYISFDHDFLEQCGVIDKDMVDDISLQAMTRKYMESIISSENIQDAYWVGAIHYDTDNIHVHTSLVQTIPNREKGKFKQQSLKVAKSAAVHALDRSHQKDTIAINDLLRNKMLEKRMGRVVATTPDLMKQYKEILSQLPDDKRLWKYNMNALEPVRPDVNRFVDAYLTKHKPNELKEFNHLIDRIDKRSKVLYGNTSTSYADNKRRDMYSRMGNALLRDMIEYSKEQAVQEQNEASDTSWQWTERTPTYEPNVKSKVKPTEQLKSDVSENHPIKQKARLKKWSISQYRRMSYLLNDEWEHYKNDLVYEQIQSEISYRIT